MAKVDWVEIEKGVYTLREKPSCPMIKINPDDIMIPNSRTEEFNPSQRINPNEPFYCDYWKKKILREMCHMCPNYLRKTCILVDKEHIMIDEHDEKLYVLQEPIKRKKMLRAKKRNWYGIFKRK